MTYDTTINSAAFNKPCEKRPHSLWHPFASLRAKGWFLEVRDYEDIKTTLLEIEGCHPDR